MNKLIDNTLSITNDFDTSAQLLEHAKKSVSGGANSMMRTLPYQLPLYAKRTEGAYVWDVDGKEYIDMNMGYGPLIFGHKPAFIIDAIREEISQRGTMLGFPHELSHKAAELIQNSFPSVERLKFASCGTELTRTAIRLARHHTGKNAIVLFEGQYHGFHDSVFNRYHASIEELEALARTRIPGTEGMGGAPYNTYKLPWNDKRALGELIQQEGDKIAAVIMEPVMGNGSVIPPKNDFLNYAREITKKSEIILVFNEIISGFRIARGGAQERYGVQADLTTMSKAMNGGVPASAIGGKKEIMEHMSKGEVYHGGVYSGNNLSLAATYVVQKEYEAKSTEIYTQLEDTTSYLKQGLKRIFQSVSIPVVIQNVGSMLSLVFSSNEEVNEVHNYREVKKIAWADRNIQFQQAMQKEGVFIHPNIFEPWFISTAHTKNVMDKALIKFERVAKQLDWIR